MERKEIKTITTTISQESYECPYCQTVHGDEEEAEECLQDCHINQLKTTCKHENCHTFVKSWHHSITVSRECRDCYTITEEYDLNDKEELLKLARAKCKNKRSSDDM